MCDYFTYFGNYMQPKWVVFWGETPEVLKPFENWSMSASYTSNDYTELDWWEAYNSVKHDRLMNRMRATLAISVKALGAVFLGILRCEYCRDAIAQVGWLSGLHSNPAAFLGEDSGWTEDDWIAAESKLFSYAVGWTCRPIPHNWTWQGPASHRFCDWFATYSRD